MFRLLNRIIKILLISFIIIPNSSVISAYASNEDNIRIQNNKVYVLGPGDKILIKIFKFENFNSTISILPDGMINLPRVGSIYIAGNSIEDAKKIITNAYSKILKRPIIYIDLIEQRPIKISITGEVQIPGIYSLGENQTNQLSNTDGGETLSISSKGFPTLIDAIQKAGGVTLDGDLKKVKISRLNYFNKKIESRIINYWDVIDNNKPFENFILFNGDNIFIPKLTKESNMELVKISSSNLSPSTITVNIIGEIIQPGSIKVKANTSLMQSIILAGGLKRTAQKKILLIRSNSDGTFFKEGYKFSNSMSLDKDFNPPIRDGDIVFVDRSNWTKSVDSLKTVVSPITPIISAASLYRILTN